MTCPNCQTYRDTGRCIPCGVNVRDGYNPGK